MVIRLFSNRVRPAGPALRVALGMALTTVVLAGPSDGAAQVIRGTVVDSASGTPVGRGFVVLLDEAGREITRELSGVRGAFAVLIPGPGTYRVRSERIAYRPVLSGPLTLGVSDTVSVTLRIPAVPIRLASIEVEEESNCRVGPAEGERTALLWSEARKALEAAAWAADRELFVHHVHMFERDLDAQRRRVEAERVRLSSGASAMPFRSTAAERLAREGYVIDEAAGRTYYAPDATTMLHDSFLATHCFRVVRDDEDGLEVGLAFEPVQDREQPDITGTLWIDAASSELRRIEYAYTGLEYGEVDRRIGGTIEFLQLPSGAWIVHRWVIRMPSRLSRRRSGVTSDARFVVDVEGFRDSGGLVTEITDTEGTVVYRSPDVVDIQGTVFDSTTGRPLRGAVVSLEGVGYEAVTGPLGDFQLSAMLDGEYGVTFFHPRLDSLAYEAPARYLEVEPGGAYRLDLAVPSERTLLGRLCPEMPAASNQWVLVGFVRDARNGRGLADAVVEARWDVIGGSAQALAQRSLGQRSVSGTWGDYVLCDLPDDELITVTATRDSVSYGYGRVVFGPGVVQMAGDLAYSVPLPSYAARGRIWTFDLNIFPPECIDRREANLRVEYHLTCNAAPPRRSGRRR